MSAPVDAYARELAWHAVAPGFRPLADAVEQLREWADDDPDAGVDADRAEAIVRELWAERERQLATTPARRPTDDQRVADAFAVLAAAGLVALADCGYDQGEGSAECEEVARREGRGGYVFFHGQDVERLAYPDATLYLGFDAVPIGRARFGSRGEYDAAAVAVGHRIARAMADHGLDVRWDGSAASRIQLVGLDWRRPLPA